MVQDAIGDWGLTFFVTQTGRFIFLGISQQFVDHTNSWIGSKIAYTKQESLNKKFGPIIHQIGAWLHKYGCYGPCGADNLEKSSPDNDLWEASRMHIVGLERLNIGFLVLVLMRKYFPE